MMGFTPAEVLAHYPLHADTLPSLVASRALTVPNALALRFGARIYTYAELTQAVSHLAAVFSAAGAETGTPIGFVAPNSDLTVLAFLAAGAIGAVFVGGKAFDVKENTSRVSADVVPTFNISTPQRCRL